MAISDKIKALLKLSGKKQSDLADYLGMSTPSLRNKLYRGYFSSDDLIKIAKFTDAKLSFTKSDGVSITIDESDISPKK